MESSTDFGRETVTFAEVTWNVGFDDRCKSGEGCGTEVTPPTNFELATVTFEAIHPTVFGRETVTFAEVAFDCRCKNDEGYGTEVTPPTNFEQGTVAFEEVPWNIGPVRMFCRRRTAAASAWFSFRLETRPKSKKTQRKEKEEKPNSPIDIVKKKYNQQKRKNWKQKKINNTIEKKGVETISA